jgi:hypothetical protein
MDKKFFASGLLLVAGKLILSQLLVPSLLVKYRLAFVRHYILVAQKVLVLVLRLAIAHLPCATAVGLKRIQCGATMDLKCQMAQAVVTRKHLLSVQQLLALRFLIKMHAVLEMLTHNIVIGVLQAVAIR